MIFKRLNILLFSGLLLVSTANVSAQINVDSKLNKVKNKAKGTKITKDNKAVKDNKTVNDAKENNTPSKPAVGASKYSKAFDDADKYASEKNYIEAYRSYSVCLEEKPGDYSAKSRRDGIADKAESQYEKHIDFLYAEGDCENYKKTIEDMVGNLAFPPGRKQSWLDKAANCEATVKANQAAALVAGEAAASAEESAKLMASLKKGEAYVSTNFVFNGPKEEVGIGESIIYRIMLEKTMLEYSAEVGVPSNNFVYGFMNLYINGDKVHSKKYDFDSRSSGVWEYIDLPVTLDPAFVKQIQTNQSLLKTPQDIMVMQEAMNPDFSTSMYVEKAAPYAEEGNFTVTLEFGFGKKDGEGPLAIIAKKQVKVKKDEKGYEEFLSRGPRYLQPLRADEIGTTSNVGKNFGMEDINIIVDLPQTPKYYNQKWCQETYSDCDYDHGNFYALLYLDDKPFKLIIPELWDASYETTKQLVYTVLPKADDGMFAPHMAQNSVHRINQKGFAISTLVDLINGGKVGVGSHTFEMKLVAGDKVPGDMALTKAQKTFINENDMFAFVAKYPAIATGKTTFNVSKDGIAKYHTKTNLDVAKGKVSKWATTESQLKANLKAKGDANIVVKDINIRWESWTVNYDVFKQPISRETTVDIYYFNKKTNSHRYLYSSGIKEDYVGGKYGKVYWTSPVTRNMNLDSWGLEPGMNYPVPGNLSFK